MAVVEKADGAWAAIIGVQWAKVVLHMEVERRVAASVDGKCARCYNLQQPGDFKVLRDLHTRSSMF